MVNYLELPIESIKEGMIVGRSIEDRYGRHLVERGAAITRFAIDELADYGVRTVLVEPEKSLLDKEIENKYSVSKYAEYIIREYRRSDPKIVTLGDSVKKRISKGIEYINQNPDSSEVAKTAYWVTEELMKAIIDNGAVAININALKCSDEYTFKHSIDVATISMVIAREQNMSDREVFEIGMAGLLHDIGKTKIPGEILNKPARLTPEEFEVMKQHSYYSYKIVATNNEIPFDVKAGILQHHEKMNGSGYPHGLTGAQIHPYAKILTVADIFDALVTERPYKKGKSPREAVEMLLAMTEELDFESLQSFMRVLILYPVDSIVQLSNGETARVVKGNKGLLLRPVVVGIETGNVYDLKAKECAGIVIV
ncbi:domain HDIG-containing protein [Lachnospiraceae bacterium JC7]|nr:domain HDIG-containing protein [Lachnospiraceae bacterium JC7]